MNELYHHGVLGQEWGKRNGPPYPLSVATVRRVYRTGQTKRKKQRIMNQMSNDDLREAIAREKLEKEYLNLNDARAKRGQVFVEKVAIPIGVSVATVVAVAAARKLAAKMLSMPLKGGI